MVFDISDQFQSELNFCFSVCICTSWHALVVLDGYSSALPPQVHFWFGFGQTQKLAVKRR